MSIKSDKWIRRMAQDASAGPKTFHRFRTDSVGFGAARPLPPAVSRSGAVRSSAVTSTSGAADGSGSDPAALDIEGCVAQFRRVKPNLASVPLTSGARGPTLSPTERESEAG